MRDAERYIVADDSRAVSLSYNAAFDAHHEIAAAHARRCIEGDPPSADELIVERRAWGKREAARRELFAGLDFAAGDYY